MDVVEPVEEEAPLLASVQLLALDAHDEADVWEPGPAFVVMYDPDIAFIRQLEVRCSSEGPKIRSDVSLLESD